MIGITELAELVRLLGYPCDNKTSEQVVRNHFTKWCEMHCGKVNATKCWQKYFETIRRNNNGKNS